MITIAMHNSLKKNAYNVRGIDTVNIKFKEGITIEEIINKYKLHEVGLVVVNGRLVRIDYLLQDEDKVEIHPMFGGG